jgi:hypothetical protein
MGAVELCFLLPAPSNQQPATSFQHQQPAANFQLPDLSF